MTSLRLSHGTREVYDAGDTSLVSEELLGRFAGHLEVSQTAFARHGRLAEGDLCWQREAWACFRGTWYLMAVTEELDCLSSPDACVGVQRDANQLPHSYWGPEVDVAKVVSS
jgi:hypothetical protein